MGYDWYTVYQNESCVSKDKPGVVFYLDKYAYRIGKASQSTKPVGLYYGFADNDCLCGECKFDVFFLEYLHECVINRLLDIEIF